MRLAKSALIMIIQDGEKATQPTNLKLKTSLWDRCMLQFCNSSWTSKLHEKIFFNSRLRFFCFVWLGQIYFWDWPRRSFLIKISLPSPKSFSIVINQYVSNKRIQWPGKRKWICWQTKHESADFCTLSCTREGTKPRRVTAIFSLPSDNSFIFLSPFIYS